MKKLQAMVHESIFEPEFFTGKEKSFYDTSRTPVEGVKIVSFDGQKNMNLPKLPNQTSYDLRQPPKFNSDSLPTVQQSFRKCLADGFSGKNKQHIIIGMICTWLDKNAQ